VITPPKVDEKFSLKTGELWRGGTGISPLGCLPLWGREGVTLIAFPKYKKMGSDRISTEQKKILPYSPFYRRYNCITQE
jgi:hypothetical protein